MQTLKEFFIDRWGLVPFAVILLGGLGFNYYALRHTQAVADVVYHDHILYYLVAVNVVLLLAAWVSYPRTYKVRAFLAGPLFAGLGIFGILYVYQSAKVLAFLTQAAASVFFIETVFVVAGLNLAFLALVPTYMEYRAVRKLALSVFAGELFLLLVWFTRYREISRPFEAFFAAHGVLFLAILAAVVLAASFWRMTDDHKMGGALAGLSVWLVFLAPHIPLAQSFAFLLALPAVLVFILAHNLVSSLHFRAQYDPLMHIYNRDFYQAILHGKAHIDLGEQYCVAVCDLDHFKQINDRAGHQVGDQVLAGTARTIQHIVASRGVVCRYGGEEIVVFFRACQMAEAAAWCEKIRSGVENQKFRSGKRQIKVAISIGVAAGAAGAIADAVSAADKALYKAKEEGRNRVVKAG
jgi:diguanylate cyclase (GGDEF)-like protein